jgi:hypothetical protein
VKKWRQLRISPSDGLFLSLYSKSDPRLISSLHEVISLRSKQ